MPAKYQEIQEREFNIHLKKKLLKWMEEENKKTLRLNEDTELEARKRNIDFKWLFWIDVFNKDDALGSPKWAYFWAKKYDGPEEKTRKVARQSPEYAYKYAKDIDGSRPDTRKAAIKHPRFSYLYADNVDNCPRPDTRRGAINDDCLYGSWWAYLYANRVDKKPTQDTLNAVLGSRYETLYREWAENVSYFTEYTKTDFTIRNQKLYYDAKEI